MTRSEFVHGIDFSAHQGEIDWERVARPGSILSPNGLRYDCGFAVGKDVEGWTPHRGADEIRHSIAAGIPTGAYGYLTPGRGARKTLLDPVEEATAIVDELEDCLSDVRLIAGDLEDWKKIAEAGHDETSISRWLVQYFGTLAGLLMRARWQGEICLYGRRATKRIQPGWGIERIASLWVPRYRTSSPGVHSGAWGDDALGELPGPYDTWLIHQYTSQGRVDGIEGDVDLNVMRRVDYRRVFGRRGLPRVMPLVQ